MHHDKQSLQRGQVSCCTSHLSKHLLWNKCLHLRSLISPPSSISYIHNTHSAASSKFQFFFSYLITPRLISEMETFCSKSIGWRHENKTESTSQDKRCLTWGWFSIDPRKLDLTSIVKMHINGNMRKKAVASNTASGIFMSWEMREAAHRKEKKYT